MPALKGTLVHSNAERELIALPAQLGGLGISILTRSAYQQQVSCAQVTAPLVDLINSNVMKYPRGVLHEHKEMKAKEVNAMCCNQETVRKLQRKQKLLKHHSQKVSRMQRSMQASERGVSTWLTAIPMTKYGFQLNKQAFKDALCLRYDRMPERLPSHCPCGEVFPVAHAFSYPKGALPSIRHNCVRDITAQLLTKVCPDVGIEPTLQPLLGKSFPLRSTNFEEGQDWT